MLKHAFGSTARRWRAAHQSELRVKEDIFIVLALSHNQQQVSGFKTQ